MMHRRGGGKFRGSNRNNFTVERYREDHDNWGNNNHNWKKSRRVSFKTSTRNNKPMSETIVKAILEDDEMTSEMAQSGSTSKDMVNFRRKKAMRKGSPIPRPHMGGRLMQHQSGWYLVTLQQGNKFEKDTLLKLLLNAVAPTNFHAHYYKTDNDNNCSQFYVDDYEVAQAILRQDKKIDLPTGFKMVIRVRGSLPITRIDDNLKQRMKMAMVKRYNAQTKAMDLTKFHADPDLIDVFCALFRPPIMAAVIDIISENIPDLEALNLNDNKLNMLDHMKVVANKLPNIKILYLANNRIFTLSYLDAFKGLPLIELFLDGNPCKKRYNDNSHYVSELKKKFPKLVKLDGVDLGPSIGFDVSDEKKHLPPWKQSFLCDASGQALIAKFLEQYFLIYDSDNRQQLLEAYHEQAMFSITATTDQHYSKEEILQIYFKNGRNLRHFRGHEYRLTNLKRGKLTIVAFLSDLPPTKHDLQSFAVDLTFFTPQMIILTVTGLFKERNPKNDYIRAFQKTLVIVPNQGGFCIKNEMLHINNASQMQAKNVFKAPQPSTTNAPMQQPQSPQQQSPIPDDATKMRMVEAMSQQSNMNLEWSKKCLEETNWDFSRAVYVFQELFKQNKIPPEAFVK